MDEGLVRERGLELRAQLADIDVDRALLLAEGPVPDHGVELLAADDAAAAPRQGGKQVELAHGQRERPASREREKLSRPDLKPTLGQDLVRCRFHLDADL